MVLISMLGDFDSLILPVFFEHKSQITLHLLVSSNNSRHSATSQRITKGLNALRTKYKLNCTLREQTFVSGNVKSILTLANEIRELAPPDQLYINISGTDTNTAILFSNELLQCGATLISYEMYANTMSHLSVSGIVPHKIKHSMGVEDHIIAKGYTLIETKDKSTLTAHKKHIEILTQNFREFQRYRKKYLGNPKTNPYDFVHIAEPLRKLGVISNSGSVIDTGYLEGGLFEEVVYFIAEKLGFDDILTGVKVRFTTTHGVTIENEFDLLMTKDNHLYIVECKFKDHIDFEHIIYKYDSLLDQMDDDGKVMLVTVSSTDPKQALKRGKKIKKNLSSSAYFRAQLHNIYIFNEPTLNADILASIMRHFFDI